MSKVVKSKLNFKGDSKKAKRKREESVSVSTPEEPTDPMQEFTGTGRITSSGTTIAGHFTEFMAQLSPGDAVVIMHPTSLAEETKIVRMVLSNASMGLSSAFSTDLISTTSFRFMKAPKDTSREEAQAQLDVTKKHKAEEEAFGTYASQGGQQLVYRVKKTGGFGGYKVITETTTKSMTREDLLQARSQKKSDRYCY